MSAPHRIEATPGRDIFDLDDVSDLPEGLRPKDRKGKNSPASDRLVALLKQANRPLKLPEMRAALFRLNGDAPCRSTLVALLNVNIDKGRLRRVSHGLYALPDADT